MHIATAAKGAKKLVGGPNPPVPGTSIYIYI